MSTSSKSDSSNTTENVTFNNMDYGEGSGEGGGAGALGRNLNLSRSDLRTGNINITETDQGAIAGGVDIAEMALNNQARATDAMYDDNEDARELTEGLFTRSVDAVNDSNRYAMQQTSQSTDRALAFAKEATRSEAGEIAENLTKYLLLGGVAIAAVAVIGPRLGAAA